MNSGFNAISEAFMDNSGFNAIGEAFMDNMVSTTWGWGGASLPPYSSGWVGN